MRIAAVLICAFILGSLWIGGKFAISFGTSLKAESDFMVVPGNIVEVAKHVHPYGEWENQNLAEVTFSYSWNGIRFSSNYLSPLCQHCEPAMVFRALGKRPSEVETGMPVNVLVLKSKPTTAYLMLPERRDLIYQLGHALLWLVLVPMGAVCFLRTWMNKNATS